MFGVISLAILGSLCTNNLKQCIYFTMLVLHNYSPRFTYNTTDPIFLLALLHCKTTKLHHKIVHKLLQNTYNT